MFPRDEKFAVLVRLDAPVCAVVGDDSVDDLPVSLNVELFGQGRGLEPEDQRFYVKEILSHVILATRDDGVP
jgi:hypothetical protein